MTAATFSVRGAVTISLVDRPDLRITSMQTWPASIRSPGSMSKKRREFSVTSQPALEPLAVGHRHPADGRFQLVATQAVDVRELAG